MKRILTLIMLTAVLLSSALSLTGCKDQEKIDIEPAVTRIEAEEKYTDGDQFWIIKYYVDPAACDLSTVNSVEIRTYITVKKNTGNVKGTYQKDFKATIPDDVAPTEDSNYVYLELSGKKYSVDDHLILLRCNALVYAGSGEDSGREKVPSIFNTIVTGIVMIIGGLVLYWVGLLLINSEIVAGASVLIPIILVITSYFSWGWARGIIMTVCFAIYIILLAFLNKLIADEL